MDIRILVYACIVYFVSSHSTTFADGNSNAHARASASCPALCSTVIQMPMPMKTICGDPGTRGESREVIDSRTLFKTETISTNESYQSYYCLDHANNYRECSEAAFVVSPVVSVQLLSFKKVQVAKFLAYAFMHSRAREENLANNRALTAFWKFPYAIPMDFKYNGHRCSEYELIMIPFVITSNKIKGSLEEVLCKFSISGEFVFALYVNLNELRVSLDFIEGSSCPDLLSRLSRFPFLGHDEAYRQLEVVKKAHLEIIKESRRDVGDDAGAVVEADI